ncbi:MULTISPECIES: hypothetical protein [Methylococcus]|uniref:Uncharacterized protein n=1 Tax=Methylococcus capsulatus TaxID=414 RepID=A0ABZ2F5B9_METCP|nr:MULTISPECIES: hypothetical protein [Methylococcus]MDF9393148.1 hypothetical protein [Methylococcus capsulatus]
MLKEETAGGGFDAQKKMSFLNLHSKNPSFLRTKADGEHTLSSDFPVIASANTPWHSIRRANGSLL